MKKIIFICPYFGKLPKDVFPLWLQSCKKNPTINWLIITDDRTQYNYPKNIKVNYSTLKQFKNKAQEKLGFKISLESPYKLCDFKPTYGYIFEDEIKNYNYWGYCDISDCIFGNMRKFLTDELLQKYDKIGILGHLSIYKNTKENNRRFMMKSLDKKSYKEILQSKNNMAFDELKPYSINAIYEVNNFKTCRIDDYYYDISPLYYVFRRCVLNNRMEFECQKNIHTFLRWNNGQLMRYYIDKGALKREELLYVHFQKRTIRKHFSDEINNYYILPEGFVYNFNINSIKQIKTATAYRPYMPFYKLKLTSLKNKLKKIL